ncbi:hypothetical protein MJO28_013347 [Puccinia striiformis f. sp. tritici]|uniref:Uncharacterized protein n=1 Tax=Puccinia striiformis f. sp. tritici TaxID=168172 RepID=A0ACC0DZW5_9BASI|nr:hypothetical protein MJO28_013347 [Puccinia striiformis f. sp. tritici]KAI7942902.1 hypothetical protein MJO29_012746 [Puccinia striiformis f. sp. tritici]
MPNRLAVFLFALYSASYSPILLPTIHRIFITANLAAQLNRPERLIFNPLALKELVPFHPFTGIASGSLYSTNWPHSESPSSLAITPN